MLVDQIPVKNILIKKKTGIL